MVEQNPLSILDGLVQGPEIDGKHPPDAQYFAIADAVADPRM